MEPLGALRRPGGSWESVVGDPDWYKNRPSAQPPPKLHFPMVRMVDPPPPAPKLEDRFMGGDFTGWVHVGFPAVGCWRVADREGTAFVGFVTGPEGVSLTPEFKTAEEAVEAAESVLATQKGLLG